MCKMAERKTKYEKVMLTVGENEKKITDATSKLLSSVTHGTLWFKIETKSKRYIPYLPIHVLSRGVPVLVMFCSF